MFEFKYIFILNILSIKVYKLIFIKIPLKKNQILFIIIKDLKFNLYHFLY